MENSEIERLRKILYSAWKNMNYRCFNPEHERFKDYGGRGLTVAQEWLDFETFYVWAIENGHEEGLSLERMDNNKGYNPSNCTWKTIEEQNRNRRNVHEITIDGVTKNAEDWCRALNLNPNTFRTRYNTYGWDIIKSLTTPVRKRGSTTSGYKPDPRRKASL